MGEHVDGGVDHDLPRRRVLASSGSGGAVPAEGAGPFPADGGDGPNVLAESGVVRRDIRSSIGDARGNGDYSLYSPAAADENYLRGVQVAGADGRLEFTSVFPGCYPGRWPHLHVEVFPAVAEATSSGRSLLTTQLAFPQDACERAYAAPEYAASRRNLSEVSLDGDFAFADGYSRQLLTMSGDNDSGWTAELTMPV